MKRIVILGCAGTGKTTFAKQLGELTGAPVICLDEIWQRHCNDKDVPTLRASIRKAHAGDEWISDGNFAVASFDIRLPRATLVIWLEQSRLSCACRAIARVFKRGEAHRFRDLLKALAFIKRFNRINRPRIEALRGIHGSGVPVCRLTGDLEVAAFLASYRNMDSDPISS